MAVEVICKTLCELGEGPTYDTIHDTLWWFDIVGKKLHEYRVSTQHHKEHDLPRMGSALGVIDSKSQLLAMDDGFYIRDIASGELTLHCALEAEKPMNRSNDGRVHNCGAFWIGTMGRNAEKEAGAIYCFFKGEITKLYDGITIPNSICFSPNGDAAFFCDTMEEVIYKVAIDPNSALPLGEPEVFINGRGGKGGMDGSIIDRDGNLWNARWGASRLDCYDAKGSFLKSISLPATQTSCPVFFGKDLDQIAVTTAWQGMGQEERKADPLAGQTFLLSEKVKGRAEPLVVL